MNKRLEVLLVEDDPADVRIIRGMLDHAGEPVELTVVDRLDRAVERLQQRPFDVVLLDLVLPDGGEHAILRLKAASSTPIVVLTGFSDRELAAQCRRQGARDFLVKQDLEGDRLLSSLRRAVHREVTAESARPSLTSRDVFLAVSALGAAREEDLARELHLTEGALQGALREAREEGILEHAAGHWRPVQSERALALRRALTYAVSYDVDYNTFFLPEFPPLLEAAYRRRAFGEREVPRRLLAPRLLWRLAADGLLLIYSYEPFLARFVASPMLDSLARYFGVEPGSDRPGPALRVERYLLERTLALRSSPEKTAARVRTRLQPPPDNPFPGPTLQQRRIKWLLQKDGEAGLSLEGEQRYQAALMRMRRNVDRGVPLSREVLEEYHRVLMGDAAGAGRLRTVPVAVPANPHFKVAPPNRVERELGEYFSRYRRHSLSELAELLELAAWMYNQLLYIHPFEDGNSRLARVVLAHFCKENRIPLEGIPPIFEPLFLEVSKGRRRRDDRALVELFKDMLIHKINRRELHLASQADLSGNAAERYVQDSVERYKAAQVERQSQVKEAVGRLAEEHRALGSRVRLALKVGVGLLVVAVLAISFLDPRAAALISVGALALLGGGAVVYFFVRLVR